MNVGLLTQKCTIMKETDNAGEFGQDGGAPLLTNVICDLDTLAAGNPPPLVAPGTMLGRAQGIVTIVDSRLGRLPNRKFDIGNWLVINGKRWEIAQIHELINKTTGELDHFELFVYERTSGG
jgi:hypothetical protein